MHHDHHQSRARAARASVGSPACGRQEDLWPDVQLSSIISICLQPRHMIGPKESSEGIMKNKNNDWPAPIWSMANLRCSTFGQ
ncbi:hypothetical protein V5799_016866 [Amblyomma americanum]|uniref:Uncharacterized protein n=1 Tax=Amblyomma americanum TaxID=6943 RepID=A0AAQ4F4Y3_AMBAM